MCNCSDNCEYKGATTDEDSNAGADAASDDKVSGSKTGAEAYSDNDDFSDKVSNAGADDNSKIGKHLVWLCQ